MTNKPRLAVVTSALLRTTAYARSAERHRDDNDGKVIEGEVDVSPVHGTTSSLLRVSDDGPEQPAHGRGQAHGQRSPEGHAQ